VTKTGAVWDGTQMVPSHTKVRESDAPALKQLRSHCEFAIQHFGTLVPYNLTGWVRSSGRATRRTFPTCRAALRRPFPTCLALAPAAHAFPTPLAAARRPR
jgi:hypothetical protein